MKKLLLLILIVFIAAEAHGQAQCNFRRNDDHSTSLQGNNLGCMAVGANEYGQLFIKEIEDPIVIVPGVLSIVETETNPTVTNITSFTLLVANPDRIDCEIQNNMESNICVSLSNETLTGIAPTATNNCKVLVPQAVITCGAPYPSLTAVTVYQASGSSTNLISVSEKE